MKILYIITQADGGGAQKYVLGLARHFGGSIAAGSEAGQLFDDARNLQITTYNLPHLKRALSPLNDFLAAWEIRRLIEREKPDIVHLNSSKAGVLGSFAAVGLSASRGSAFGGKTKVVFTAHGFIFNEPMGAAKRNFFLALEKMASNYRDYIITVSEADKQSALANKLISPDKISTIHNGIGQIQFLNKQEARRSLKIADDKIIIGTVANFYKTKGLDVLVEAAAKIDEQIISKLQIVILGDGAERKNLELGIRNYGLEKYIKLLGEIRDASKYLKAFDIFVLPSRKEGFPYAILEAIQAGLPIIATNVGGVPEALGGAGMLVKSEDPGALAGGISFLINNPEKMRELSQNSLERSNLFDEQKMLEDTEKIYQHILKAPR
ncbi:MAG: glycosyltransferase family 4 protein [Candidatus Doudnabacteria bacterium]|nr:glycosyltransferase family 4 protein [Candidatus Doudnabacteria bacterium]